MKGNSENRLFGLKDPKLSAPRNIPYPDGALD